MDAMEKARKRIKEQKEFYTHLATYVICGAFFFLLNVVTSPFHWWFVYPMLGWGIGLATHYFKVFGVPGSGIGSNAWEEKALEREMRRLTGGGASRTEDDEYLELREINPEGKSGEKARKGWREDDLV
jgi:hypothetical protein